MSLEHKVRQIIKRTSVDGDGNSALVGNADGSGIATLRPCGLLLAGSGAANATKLLVISSPAPFFAVQLSYPHIGGGGDCAGIKASVACTDDPGPMDYALGGTDANFKKATTPRRGGTEYNTLSANGWQAVTWAGNASASITDPGADLIALATSDIIPVVPIQAADGLYYVLIRVYDGAGAYTRGGYVGFVTGTQYGTDATPWRVVSMFRGGDHVTNPSTWTTALTPSFAETAICPVIVRLHGLSNKQRTLMMCGDSRFDAVSEPAPVPQYRSSGFLLSQKLNSLGARVALVRAAYGGATSAGYLQHGLKMLEIAAPSVALYNIYSVNDGTATQAIIDAAKARTWTFVRAALAKGCQPVLVTSWPMTGMSGGVLALLQALDTWAAETGIPYISPLARYGNSAGAWAGSWGYDSNHGTQALYQRFADDTAAQLISLGYI